MKRSRRGGRRPPSHGGSHNSGGGSSSNNNGGYLNPNRTYDSNGPEIKVRGSASHVYEKYLQLDPNGPMAADAKNILEQIGSKQAKSYKAK